MIRVLHFCPTSDSMIAQYVAILCQERVGGVDSISADTKESAIQQLRSHHYDILHIHGCWNYSAYSVSQTALKYNTRLVVSPHGQLAQWVIRERYWTEKLPKNLLFQKRIIQQSYVIVVQGEMERDYVCKLHWNPRCVIIRNSIITSSIQEQEMKRQLAALYRQVMDTYTLNLMTDATKNTFKQLLKCGITGDVRWLKESVVNIADQEQWRMALLYAYHEQVLDVIKKGISVMQLSSPDFSHYDTPVFLPYKHQKGQSIGSAIGMQYASENDRLLATFTHLRKLNVSNMLRLMHLVELDKELRTHDAVEDALCENLQKHNLLKFSARVMQLMKDFTGLEEGFMPVPPLNDRITKTMNIQIQNNLKL